MPKSIFGGNSIYFSYGLSQNLAYLQSIYDSIRGAFFYFSYIATSISITKYLAMEIEDYMIKIHK